MFKNDAIELKKTETAYQIVTKKRKSIKLTFEFSIMGSLLHIQMMPKGTAEVDEFLTRNELLTILKGIGEAYPRKTIAILYYSYWGKKSKQMINQVFDELGYKSMDEFQNMLVDSLSGGIPSADVIKVREKKYQKIVDDREKKEEAIKQIIKKYPTFEYKELYRDKEKLMIRYYMEGEERYIGVGYSNLRERYFIVQNLSGSNQITMRDKEIDHLLCGFFQKEYEKNRIKTIYQPSKHHFNLLFNNDLTRQKIYSLLSAVLNPNEIEELAARNKKRSTTHSIGRIKIFTIGEYTIFFKGKEEKLFLPSEKEKAKYYFEQSMQEETVRVWGKVGENKDEKSAQ